MHWNGLELAEQGRLSIHSVFTKTCSHCHRQPVHNCIAWAAGDVKNWWWPDEPAQPDSASWPPTVPRERTLDAFRQAFAALGYTVCEDEEPEAGHEKIALFAASGVPTHAARTPVRETFCWRVFPSRFDEQRGFRFEVG